MNTVAGWVLALLVVIGAGVGIETGAGVGVGSSNSSDVALVRPHRDPRSELAMRIDQVAVNLAAHAGDPNVSSVTWVASTSGPAASVVSGGSDGTTDRPVYVLEVPGTFVLKRAPVPRGASAPRCTVAIWTIAQGSLQGEAISCRDFTTDLSALGTPETDSLVGLKPNL